MTPALKDPEDRALDEQRAALEDKLHSEMVRAREAQLILENPILNDALDLIENSWSEAWRNTAPNEQEKREAAYRMLAAATEFRTQLQSVIETGKMAAQTTDAMQRDPRGSRGDTLRDIDE